MLKETIEIIEQANNNDKRVLYKRVLRRDSSYIPRVLNIPNYSVCGKKFYYVDKQTKQLTAIIPLEFTLINYYINVFQEFHWLVTIKTPNGIKGIFADECEIYESIDAYYNEDTKPFNFMGNVTLYNTLKNNSNLNLCETLKPSNDFYFYSWRCKKGENKARKIDRNIEYICYNKNGIFVKLKDESDVFDTEKDALRNGKVNVINDFDDENEEELNNEFIFNISLKMNGKTIEEVKKILYSIIDKEQIITIK